MFITEVDIVDVLSLTKLPDLKMIATCRANPVNIDIKACTKLGIPVLNAPGRNADAVADISVGFMLMLARMFPEVGEFLREPGSEAGDMGRMGMAHGKFQGKEMWRKTVGLVGMGAVGCETAKRVCAFKVDLLIYDPYITSEQAILAGGRKVPLDTLLSESDFICLHAPVTEETYEMIDEDAFGKMKDGVFLINTARAALIDEDALFDALESGKLGGAALDVFSDEPPGADDPLFSFPNVIGTPHIGGNTLEVGAHQGRIVSDDLARLINGEKPQHIVNSELMESFNWQSKHNKLSEAEIEELTSSAGPGVSDLEVEAKKKTKEKKKNRNRRSVKAAGSDETAAALSDAEFEKLRTGMTSLLAEFTQNIVEDDVLLDFSKDKDVIMHFIITDLDLEFFLSLKEGTLESDLGTPPDPDVVLKMRAEIIHGIFTGNIKGMSAAMDGELSFSGDTAKAMTFQSIQNDLIRLYCGAREKADDPGDLSQIGKAQSTIPEPQQQDVAIVTAPAVIKVGDIRDEILEIMNELYAKELITATGGNVSARVPGKEDEIWISPSQINKGGLRADMMVKIDLDGHQIDPDGLAASTERNMHAGIYKKRPEVNAVIHSHAPVATILGLKDTPFLPICTESAFIGNLQRVPFTMPGSQELADAVAEAIGEKGIAVLLQNHGLIVAGTSLRRVLDMTDVIEVTSKTLIACRNLDVEVPVLPDDLVKNLQEIGEMMA